MKYKNKLLKELFFAGFIILTLNVANADLTQGLVADIPFSNGVIEDVSGNGYLVVGYGDVIPTDGHIDGQAGKNSAYKFNGGFIQTDIDGTQITDAMSVTFWLKTSHDCYRNLLGYCRDYAAVIFSTSSNEETGHFYKYISDYNHADDLVVKINLHDDEWHHIVTTFSQEYTKIYVDGLLQDKKSVDSFTFKGDVFKFGKDTSTSPTYFRGDLDDIKIYDRVLSKEEVRNLKDLSSNNKLRLDIDGDGYIKPLSDSLLILRYNFGFSGSVLINNAISANCTRCTSIEITSYLDELFNLKGK